MESILRFAISCRRCIFVSAMMVACNVVQASPSSGGSIAWTSDYVLRGVSQSQNLPAIQADLHLKPNTQWVVGLWASTVHVRPQTNSTELDVYLGRHWNLNQDWLLNVTATHYQYLNDPRLISYDYDELAIGVQWADTLSGKINWSPNTSVYDYYGSVLSSQHILTAEVAYHLPLPFQLSSDTGIGLYIPLQLDEGRYVYGSTALRRQFGDFGIEIHYFWVQDKHHRRYNPGPRGTPWVLSARWKF